MQQIRCDRCSSLSDDQITGHGWHRVRIDTYEHHIDAFRVVGPDHLRDLCFRCSAELREWLEGHES